VQLTNHLHLLLAPEKLGSLLSKTIQTAALKLHLNKCVVVTEHRSVLLSTRIREINNSSVKVRYFSFLWCYSVLHTNTGEMPQNRPQPITLASLLILIHNLLPLSSR
jgi:hypothetical protein